MLATLVFTGFLLLTGGCRADSADAQTPRESARTVAHRLGPLRAARQYSTLAREIVPAHAHQVVETLLAIDAFLDENERLTAWVRDHVGLGAGQQVDFSDLAADFTIFAPAIKTIAEQYEGDTAIVTFNVAGNPLMQYARFQNVAGAWKYNPEAGFTPDLPAGFRALADGLQQVRRQLEDGQIDAARVRTAPEELLTRLRTALTPGLDLLSRGRRAVASQPAPQP